MVQPTFVVTESFRHKRPEYVRRVAQQYGFECRTRQGTAKSEIWVLQDDGHGNWIIRMDTMGRDTQYHFGARPHYHKNWVESQQMLERYLRQYTPGAWVCADNGRRIGRAGGGQYDAPGP